MPAPVPGVKGTALAATYDEGFRLRTNDGSTDLRLAWSAQLDTRVPLSDSVVPVGFDIRRARLDFIATVSRRLFMRIGLAAEDAPYIRNAFADYEIDELLHVRLGQLKVPFSTEWATFDNQVNFLERAYSQPVHPFLDRGVLLWGKLPGSILTWNAGVFAGAGVDADAPRGDVDDGKQVAFRLFAQPFRRAEAKAARGFYFVTQGTWEEAELATKRFEMRGSTTPAFESSVWRWKGPEKATLASKARIGGELHYLFGPLTVSGEAATLRWTQLERTSGSVTAVTAWASVFLTGEEKVIDNFGWRQPNPKRPVFGGDPSRNGAGAIELLARASTMRVDDALFPLFEGARRMNEVTFGVNWTLAYAARLQLNVLHTWVPDAGPANGIVSGASSEASSRARLVPSETMVGLRAIFRI
jgi:phosphate-selective porin